MRSNLTKRQVRSVGTLELAMRFNRLMHMGETMPAGIITYPDMRETLWIEDELHRRLIVAVGHDFYPPDRAKPTIGELRGQLSPFKRSIPAPRSPSKPAPAPKTLEPAEKIDGMLRFKITITSSIGSIVATRNVKVDSKGQADIMAGKIIEQLGLKKATYKIS